VIDVTVSGPDDEFGEGSTPPEMCLAISCRGTGHTSVSSSRLVTTCPAGPCQAAAPHPRLDRPVPTISALIPQGIAAITRFERRRLWPAAASEALDAWASFLRDSSTGYRAPT
jgi:hypothetical protein